MLTSEFKPWHVPIFLAKYAYLTVTRRPVLVHFEVTMRCNAHCSFCDYWKTDPAAKATELKSFAEAARFFNPMLVTFTGGEPTLSEQIIEFACRYATAVAAKKGAAKPEFCMISNGVRMSDRLFELIREFEIQVTFSVDGPKAPTRVLQYANADDPRPGYEWSSLAPGKIILLMP